MTLTATYNNDISRVHLVVSGASTDSDYCYFQRSVDGINWVDVQGAQTIGLTGGACSVDDYLFTPNVVNTYRATYVDTATPSWIGSSGPFSAVNTSLAPLYNGSTITGDLILLLATIRSATATVNTPSGWTLLVDGGNMRLFGKIQDGAATPTVTFTGGVAGDDVTAQTTTLRNCGLTPRFTSSVFSNGSAQNIAYPGVPTDLNYRMSLIMGWKQDDWTSIPVPSPWDAEVGNVPVTAGNDAGHIWEVKACAANVSVTSGSWVVTGGAAAISKSAAISFVARAFTSQDTTTCTPAMTDVWLKNVLRPNLNMIIPTEGDTDITEPSRSNIFAVIGRNLPVAVTDVRGSQQYSLYLGVLDNTTRDNLRNALATGDVMYLHIPNTTTYPVKSMFVLVGNTDWRDRMRQYTLPLTQVAAPDGTIIGDTVLWLDVIATYATWNDLIAAKATWSDVVSMIAPGGQVIVG